MSPGSVPGTQRIASMKRNFVQQQSRQNKVAERIWTPSTLLTSQPSPLIDTSLGVLLSSRPKRTKRAPPSLPAAVPSPSGPVISRKSGRIAKRKMVEAAPEHELGETTSDETALKRMKRGRPPKRKLQSAEDSADAAVEDTPMTKRKLGRPPKRKLQRVQSDAKGKAESTPLSQQKRGRLLNQKLQPAKDDAEPEAVADAPLPQRRRGRRIEQKNKSEEEDVGAKVVNATPLQQKRGRSRTQKLQPVEDEAKVDAAAHDTVLSNRRSDRRPKPKPQLAKDVAVEEVEDAPLTHRKRSRPSRVRPAKGVAQEALEGASLPKRSRSRPLKPGMDGASDEVEDEPQRGRGRPPKAKPAASAILEVIYEQQHDDEVPAFRAAKNGTLMRRRGQLPPFSQQPLGAHKAAEAEGPRVNTGGATPVLSRERSRLPRRKSLITQVGDGIEAVAVAGEQDTQAAAKRKRGRPSHPAKLAEAGPLLDTGMNSSPVTSAKRPRGRPPKNFINAPDVSISPASLQ